MYFNENIVISMFYFITGGFKDKCGLNTIFTNEYGLLFPTPNVHTHVVLIFHA